MGYYLAYGNYPPKTTLVKTIQRLKENKRSHIVMCQLAALEDVERDFGVLWTHFAIVCDLIEYWDQKILFKIMTTCAIFDNMIIKGERSQRDNFDHITMGCKSNWNIKPPWSKDSSRCIRWLKGKKLMTISDIILWSTCGNFLVLYSYAFIIFYLDYSLHPDHCCVWIWMFKYENEELLLKYVH